MERGPSCGQEVRALLEAEDFPTHSHPAKRPIWGPRVTVGAADLKLETRREHPSQRRPQVSGLLGGGGSGAAVREDNL